MFSLWYLSRSDLSIKSQNGFTSRFLVSNFIPIRFLQESKTGQRKRGPVYQAAIFVQSWARFSSGFLRQLLHTIPGQRPQSWYRECVCRCFRNWVLQETEAPLFGLFPLPLQTTRHSTSSFSLFVHAEDFGFMGNVERERNEDIMHLSPKN